MAQLLFLVSFSCSISVVYSIHCRINASKASHGVNDIMNRALASGGSERLNPHSKALVATGESKVPFSQGIVPRKAPTMPKPEWHAPWKLMRVICFYLFVY